MRLANIFRNGGHPRPIAYRQGGFTLIEVMIAVLVLLVGLLGVAGIQIVSFQNNQGAYFRSQATFMASDFLDRMRANPAGRSESAYDGVNTNSVTAPSCDIASSAGCSGRQVARNDIAELAAQFTTTPPVLPNGFATVSREDSTGFDEYTVTVFWTEKSWAGTGGAVVRDGTALRSVELRTIIK